MQADFAQVFARKLIRLAGTMTFEIVANEFRAVDKFHSQGHKNIIQVFGHGQLKNTAFCYIDMELCDLNLRAYIARDWPDAVVAQLQHFTIDLPPKMKWVQIMGIMDDVVCGLAFIHSHGEVHRDIKPQNSTAYFSTI
jgi:serine/threonine protein kinase